MLKKITIFMSVMVVIIIVETIIIGYSVLNKYNFFAKQPAVAASVDVNNAIKKPNEKPLTPEQQAAKIEKEYPQLIEGTINFLNKGKELKTTIKADNGKEYILWPPQPEAIYKSFGVKNGQKVQVHGKLNSQGNLEWAELKPI